MGQRLASESAAKREGNFAARRLAEVLGGEWRQTKKEGSSVCGPILAEHFLKQPFDPVGLVAEFAQRLRVLAQCAGDGFVSLPLPLFEHCIKR